MDKDFSLSNYDYHDYHKVEIAFDRKSFQYNPEYRKVIYDNIFDTLNEFVTRSLPDSPETAEVPLLTDEGIV